MTGVRSRGEDVRNYILAHIEKHPADISKITANQFGITRQAVNKHLQKLTSEKALAVTGNTRNKSYKIVPLSQWIKTYKITPGLAEDAVWRNDISTALNHLPANVLNIWHYGFTEMFNNAIDHSGGTSIIVQILKTAANSQILGYNETYKNEPIAPKFKDFIELLRTASTENYKNGNIVNIMVLEYVNETIKSRPQTFPNYGHHVDSILSIIKSEIE